MLSKPPKGPEDNLNPQCRFVTHRLNQQRIDCGLDRPAMPLDLWHFLRSSDSRSCVSSIVLVPRPAHARPPLCWWAIVGSAAATMSSSSPCGFAEQQRYLMDEPIFGASSAAAAMPSSSPCGFTEQTRHLMDEPIFGPTAASQAVPNSPLPGTGEQILGAINAAEDQGRSNDDPDAPGSVADTHVDSSDSGRSQGGVVLPLAQESQASPSGLPTASEGDFLLGGGDYYPLNIIMEMDDGLADADVAAPRGRGRTRAVVDRSRSPPSGGRGGGSHALGFSALRHQSVGAAFWEAVVGRPRDEVLGRRALANMTDGVTYENAMLIARRHVSAVARSGQPFYIGITENPTRRFGEHCDGGGQVWERMTILVQAVSSRTTASMERELLREFRDRVSCHNNSAGGEGASAGSPHFLYVLQGGHNLFRRSR